MPERRLRFSEHAIDRMLEQAIDVDDVYEDGSRLVLGRAGVRPRHVVVAEEVEEGSCTVVTVVRAGRKSLGSHVPDPETRMKCVLCHNGETKPGFADKACSHDGMTLVIKDVPAEICENCGERYFDAEVTRELLRIARTAASEGVVVDVRRYVAA